MEEHIPSHKQPQYFKCDECIYTNKIREAVMNHKQLWKLKCNMCNYTNKNEARLNEHKESHKNKELLKCDMCNFAEEDPSLMQKHKESHKERSELKCLMCGSILPSWQQAGSPIVDRPSTSFLGIVWVGWWTFRKNSSALILTVWEWRCSK